ncbi:MAG: Dolichol-phosphate mannosyltransferase in lipid-linked oligosaccharide synthesis cluster, partial [uncultured Actinomycetospora sp.]
DGGCDQLAGLLQPVPAAATDRYRAGQRDRCRRLHRPRQRVAPAAHLPRRSTHRLVDGAVGGRRPGRCRPRGHHVRPRRARARRQHRLVGAGTAHRRGDRSGRDDAIRLPAAVGVRPARAPDRAATRARTGL